VSYLAYRIGRLDPTTCMPGYSPRQASGSTATRRRTSFQPQRPATAWIDPRRAPLSARKRMDRPDMESTAPAGSSNPKSLWTRAQSARPPSSRQRGPLSARFICLLHLIDRFLAQCALIPMLPAFFLRPPRPWGLKIRVSRLGFCLKNQPLQLGIENQGFKARASVPRNPKNLKQSTREPLRREAQPSSDSILLLVVGVPIQRYLSSGSVPKHQTQRLLDTPIRPRVE
jgi:hypothetical protein